MSDSFLIEDARGPRRLGSDDFPLVIGGPNADVRLNGFDGPAGDRDEPLAYLGLSEGDVFVQPAEGDVSVACNGTPLATSHWLRDGDVLRFGPARLAVEVADDEMRFVVGEAEAEDARPPVVLEAPPRQGRAAGSGAAGSGPGAAIRPIEFKPSRALMSSGPRRRFRLSTVIVFLFLAGLATAAAFVFTARSVQVEIDPPPDRMALEGGFGVDLRGRHLLRPGRYTLVAEKEGYRRLTAPIEVGRDAHQVFSFQFESLPGRLTIAMSPVEGAEVLIDGETVGPVSAEPLELAPGDYEVRILAARHRDFAATVTIPGGGAAETLTAELVPLWAPVSFSSKPAGAAIRLDGGAAGKTPVTVELLEGGHTYELFLAGYKPHRGRVSVTASQPRTVPSVALVPSDGNVALVSVPAGASVTVGGAYRGQTPLDLRLEPGREHEVKVSKAGYEAQARRVEVKPEEAREVRLTLTALEGDLEIVAWPADAELYVDGEARGRASQSLRLTAVPHEIEIRKPGYAAHTATVTPMHGIPQSINVKLATLEEEKARGTVQLLYGADGHQLRRVEPGRFVMGASRREPGRRANEVLREVELTRPFYLGTREVTNAQFRRFEADHLSGHFSGKTLENENHPAVEVTWQQAASYCNWLSSREDLPPAYVVRDGQMVLSGPGTTGYRLPTEAEWAWAARFPDGRAAVKYPWGGSLPVASGSGNYADASAQGVLPGILTGYNDQFPLTAPVASFGPNALDLYDLGGNVAEWVHDLYALGTGGGLRLGGGGSQQVARDPFGPAEGEFHVIRGSSWMHSTITELRLTYRDYGNKKRPDVGFRIARYVE